MSWINELYEIFQAVQESEIFEDQKFFADCTPISDFKDIRKDFSESSKTKKDLKILFAKHFQSPEAIVVNDDLEKVNILQHIDNLWSILAVKNTKDKGSLIGVPSTYVKPGGRFREYYYWDSFFTMLGLKVAGKEKLVESMVNNFSFLIKKFGFIPNGTRTYFLSRSQPPFYALMVDLLAQMKGDKILIANCEHLELEYQFWMKGKNLISDEPIERVIQFKDGEIGNRYFDNENKPRPESYLEDTSLPGAKTDDQLFINIRAACESGWDFSSRWLRDSHDLNSIYTARILPIDLNCLLYYLESLLAKCYQLKGNQDLVEKYKQLAENRKFLINKYCWSEALQMYMDYDFDKKESTPSISMAAMFPLFFNIASKDNAQKVLTNIEKYLLKDGGLITTTINSGQQWDAPNAWAPLQYIGYIAAKNYGQHDFAQKIKNNWMKNVERVFDNTGKLMEKYNAIDTTTKAGGGEYPNQDGFGWTNGVYLFFANE